MLPNGNVTVESIVATSQSQTEKRRPKRVDDLLRPFPYRLNESLAVLLFQQEIRGQMCDYSTEHDKRFRDFSVKHVVVIVSQYTPEDSNL